MYAEVDQQDEKNHKQRHSSSTSAAAAVEDESFYEDDDPTLGLERIAISDAEIADLPPAMQSKLRECVDLFNRDKLVAAGRLLDELENMGQSDSFWRENVRNLRQIRGMTRMCHENRRLLRLLQGDDGWKSVKKSQHIEVFHRAEPGSALHGFKVEATLKAPLRNLLALVNEVSLYSQWLPFLTRTEEAKKFHRCAKVALVEFRMIWPFANRDVCVRGVASDNLDESPPNVTLTFQSFESITASSQFPPRHGVCRLEVKYGALCITPISKNEVRVAGVVHVDPQLAVVPSSLINWIAISVAFYGIKYFEKRARSISTAKENDPHVMRMKTDTELYAFVDERVAATHAKLADGDNDVGDASDDED